MNDDAPRPKKLRRPGRIDAWARGVVQRRLEGLRHGALTIVDGTQTRTFGDPEAPASRIVVRDPRLYRRALFGGTVAVADAYVTGEWYADDLTSVMRLFLRNRAATSGLDATLSSVARLAYRLRHALRPNSRNGSRDNVRAHYDLGNEFFELWLDETLAYSSGIFLEPTDDLHTASIEKFERVCRNLDLRAGDRVLEIGCGWGGFAMHAARHYGCRVVAATISQAQFEAARRRVAEAGLDHRVSVVLKDYRDLEGSFDKLVSIEMIEAVGYRNFDAFFRKCGELLEPDGACLLQAIVLPDQAYPKYLRSTDFIQRSIFPGGCLASVGAMLASASRSTDLRLVRCEEFGPHYAETLRRWRERFLARLDAVRELGYPERFIRLWTYYLCYCEAAFDERRTGVVQIEFEKPRRRSDIFSAAIAREERAAKSSEEPPVQEWTSPRAMHDDGELVGGGER